MLNTNNSPNAPNMHGGQQLDPVQPINNMNIKKENTQEQSLQNTLRKSMPGSSSGLKHFSQKNQDALLQQQLYEHQQQKIIPNVNNRQSHSHSSHAQHSNGQTVNHDKNINLNQNQQQSNSYHSVSSQNRGLPHHVGLYIQNQGKITSNVQATQNFIGQNSSQVNINSLQNPGNAASQNQAIKFHNQAILGITNQGANLINHKQFSMSTQHGLFPKITNLRIENQSIPNSAHSQAAGILQAGGGIKAVDTMNALKNSGGHISGMSNHQTHLNQKDNIYRNGIGSAAPSAKNAQISVGQNHGAYKPLSSPRQNQQQYHQLQNHLENALTTDPNLLYQQQLQWKTQAQMNVNPQAEANGFSPITGNSQGIQNQLDYQRAKQMSSGSEKRLKMHQQRQYYSEQYRVAQQRQHQQTANAVLKQNNVPNNVSNAITSNNPDQSSTQPKSDFNNSTTTSNSNQQNSNFSNMHNIQIQNPSGRASQVEQIKSGEYVNNNQQRINQQANMNHSQQPSLTPQLYSQQKQKIINQVGMSQSIMNSNQILSQQVPLNASMASGQQNTNIQQHQMINQNQNQQANGQAFFKKRASSNNAAQNLVASPNREEAQNQQSLASKDQNVVSSPKNQIIGSNTTHQNHHISSTIKTPNPPQQNGQIQTPQQQQPGAAPNSDNKQQVASQQQQQPPKIPVICGFHKRILLITCQNQNQEGMQNGMTGFSGINPNSSMSQARRIRNKNPNCNHNSNSVFYQPHYNNVKYDDSHKKKEDVLRKVFFKECAKEEEKRLYNGSQMYPNGAPFGVTGASGHNGLFGPSEMARQQAFSQANDPNKHLQIIERILCEYLFVSQPFDRNAKTQLTNTQSLMMELGLDRALTPHRAFLLALIRAGKFTTDNMLKVLSEVKTSATEFDNECIYCKYSQYALKESAKLLQKHQQALLEQSQTNPQAALAAQQQIQANGGIIKGPSGEDIRIENLVRMFQSQLFKKSFINTSLMIIQRKMTEKYFQKYHNAKQAQQAAVNEAAKNANGGQVQYGPDGKPLEPKKPSKKMKPKQFQNLSSLEYLAKEIQKLSKNLANPKDKERYLDLKEKYYREFLIKILKSNGVEKIQFPTSTFTPYKYHIGRGNNSGIVRTALKSRFWWSMGEYDDWNDYNFIWTQWKSNKVLGCLKTWKEHQEHEAKEVLHPDKKRSSQSTRAGGHIDSQLSTQATDKESTSSKENLITTPKKNKLASSTLGNNSSEPQFRKNNNTNSASKNSKIIGRGKKGDDKDEEKEENITSHKSLIYSKQENNYHLSNKKAIYYNMKVYYEAIGVEYHTQLPITFHIKEGLNDPQFLKFEQLYSDANQNKETILDTYPKFGKNLWIIKPGENTNRGCGIQVCKELDQIKNLVQNTNFNGNKRSYIIQKYIEKPLLYKNRKFDIRAFTMMCTINGNLQGYWYQEGYFRTSCREFTLKNVSNRYVHLTNDAVQKKLDDYGKFESGNKLSYSEFQKYLDTNKIDFDLVKDIVPKMKSMAQQSMRAVSRKLDPSRKTFSFEIYGYDFMIDEDLNPWMIEVNTNPCFELSSPYLARLIPAMVENSLKIAVDPLFPPPPVPNSKKHQLPDASDNKFELIFNERTDANELKNLPIDDNMNGIIEEEEMEEEGSDDEEEHQDQE